LLFRRAFVRHREARRVDIRHMTDRSRLVDWHFTHALACRSAQDREAVPFGGFGDMDDFSLQLLEFEVQVAALRIVVGVVDCLDREFAHPLHHVRDLVGRPFGGLDQVDGVACVPHGLVQAANLVGHPGRNGQARSVVGSGIDPLAGRQLCHRLGHRPFRAFQG
jgi:hypothetical protein